MVRSTAPSGLRRLRVTAPPGPARLPGPVLVLWEDRSRGHIGYAWRLPHDSAVFVRSMPGAGRNDPPGAPFPAPGGRPEVPPGEGPAGIAASLKDAPHSFALAALTHPLLRPFPSATPLHPLLYGKKGRSRGGRGVADESWVGGVTTCETPSHNARQPAGRGRRNRPGAPSERSSATPHPGSPSRGASTVGLVGLLGRSGARACPNLLQRRPGPGSMAGRSAEYQRFSSRFSARSGPLQQIWTNGAAAAPPERATAGPIATMTGAPTTGRGPRGGRLARAHGT